LAQLLFPETIVRFATLLHEGRRRVGRVIDDEVELFDTDASGGVLALIERDSLPAVEARIALAGAKLLAPIPRPRRNLWCVGRNYHAHARELNESVFKDHKAEGWPIVFTKAPETVVATAEPVRLPGAAVSTQIDYEAELAVVIGRGGRNITRADAMQHVWGYTIVNDVTARDVQMRHSQWDLGKSFDTFCPMGPWVVTADELNGQATRVRCWVTPAGGAPELRQDANTRDLIFDIPALIETCSRGITLLPGDVIATGSPAGVGMGMKPPRWLGPGDTVRIEIDGIGVLENRFVDEAVA
jgi:2-keto-4-pentenoate hydratase/2-oxohepta-3-ene-1,7-dioic acid hydratase in catechol pathway